MSLARTSFVSILLLAACGGAGPEAEIRENIAYMQQAVEDRESGASVKYLAEHFTGALLRHQKINVAITRLDISVNEYNPVTARMNAVVIVTGADGLLPRDGDLINVSGDWELHSGEWLLVNAQWE
jgi:hypothetical protein